MAFFYSSTLFQRLMSRLRPILRSTCQYLTRRHVVNVANREQQTDAFELLRPSLSGLMEEIHSQLASDLVLNTELRELSR